MQDNSADGNSLNYSADTVVLAKQGDNQAMGALLCAYIPIIRKKASAVRLISMDADDISQEGFIGLLDAVNGYDEQKGGSFAAFANTCIDNRIKKAIAKVNTQKSAVLNNSVNLDEVSRQASSPKSDPQNIYIEKEMFLNLQRQLDLLLSSFERKVLSLYLSGCSYESMAKTLGRSDKSIDNALQRIRRKLKLASI